RQGAADALVVEAVEQAGAVGGVTELAGRRGDVVLTVGNLHMRQCLGAAADEVAAPPEQVTVGPHLGPVDVRLGPQAGGEQVGDLLAFELVALGLGAVDGPHLQGVPQDEGDALGGAGVGQPVPGDHALAGDDQAVAVGRDGPEGVPLGGGDVLVQQGAPVTV